MPVPIKYHSVNWVNGMKIRKEHFQQMDNALDDRLRDVSACFLSAYHYGLLPDYGDGGSFKVAIQTNNQKFVTVKLFRLRAFTPGGARIELLNDATPRSFEVNVSNELELARKEGSGLYYVVVTVDLFSKEPFGEIDPEEEPPRFPNAAPEIKVTLLPAKEAAQTLRWPFSMLVGKLMVKPDAPEVLDEYIPACMSLRSHEKLTDFHTSVEKFYNQLEINLLSIIRKIKEKGQDSSLAASVRLLCENLMAYLNVNTMNMKWHMSDLPPIHLFSNIASLARIMRNSIDCNTAADKEEMLNYFTNWSELKQGDFEKLLVYCINFQYNHYEIGNSIDEFSEFIQISDTLFTKLESLAFIGKKKETSIFVKEQTVKRSFLAD